MSVLEVMVAGMQMAFVDDIETLGRRLEVLELGTAARFDVGATVPFSIPTTVCWAYPDTGAVKDE